MRLPATHGHARGGRRSREYIAWCRMLTRCRNVANVNWPRYGGRGICVCDRWADSFAAFLLDMGPRPPGTTLDRIDVNGNYEPGNCRWATWAEQGRNRSSNVRFLLNGVPVCQSELCAAIGAKVYTFGKRAKRYGYFFAAMIPEGGLKNWPRP